MQFASLAHGLTASSSIAVVSEITDTQIISLCGRAVDELDEVRSLEDILDFCDAGKALAINARKRRLPVETQNACKLVVLLAEARIGIALRPDRGKAKLPPSDFGVQRGRAADYRALAAAGESEIYEEVEAANRDKRPASRARIIEAGRLKQTAAKTRRQIMLRHNKERSSELVHLATWVGASSNFASRFGDYATLASRLEAESIRIDVEGLRKARAILTALELGHETAIGASS